MDYSLMPDILGVYHSKSNMAVAKPNRNLLDTLKKDMIKILKKPYMPSVAND